jgi:antitoxin component of RelBE/YafQ-DinJ toxin-antitoxin module
MKQKFNKNITYALRLNEKFAKRLDALSEKLELNRSDMIRMFLNVQAKYWESKFSNSTPIPQTVDTKTGYINQVSEQELAELAKEMEQFK